jgi:hypothetical protein
MRDRYKFIEKEGVYFVTSTIVEWLTVFTNGAYFDKEWMKNQLAFFKNKYKTENDYQVWQEGVHPELIQNQEMLLQKIE